ncbi:MAG: methyltransferase domain-containing protein [Propionibacteriales bacterium]|nr:methyltransferase domain-containing protein [Propionibacteriales bacterium]
MPTLAITGERTVPGMLHENYWFRRHEVAYRMVCDLVGPGQVLEAGCGEGYGAELLRGQGVRVVALDYDGHAVRHVRRTYPRLHVVQGNLCALPFADAAYDLVVSLQTVEHLWDQPGFVSECLRVLAPGGVLALSTPNRLTFPPGNIFHTRELTAGELWELVAAHAEPVSCRGIGHGPRLKEWERARGDLVGAQLERPPDAWPGDLRRLVAGVGVDDFALDDDLDRCLDLFLVARK